MFNFKLDFLSFSFIQFPLQGVIQRASVSDLCVFFARALALEPVRSLGLVFGLGRRGVRLWIRPRLVRGGFQLARGLERALNAGHRVPQSVS